MKLQPPPELAIDETSPYWGYATSLVGVTPAVDPHKLIEGFESGLCAMKVPEEFLVDPSGVPVMGWWSPDPRAVIPLEDFHVSRSLRRSLRSFRITSNLAFRDVVVGCQEQKRTDAWIDEGFVDAYCELARQGRAASVEVWLEGLLVGGVFGVHSGAAFSGESMFHRSRDASKAALAGLVGLLRSSGFELLDVQWQTPHLRSMGAQEISKDEYTVRLMSALGKEPGQVNIARDRVSVIFD